MRYAIIFLDRERVRERERQSRGLSLKMFRVFLTSGREQWTNFQLSIPRVRAGYKQKEQENEFTGT